MMITVATGPLWGPGALLCGGSVSSSYLGGSLVTSSRSHRHGLQQEVSVLLECRRERLFVCCPDELRWSSCLAFYQQPRPEPRRLLCTTKS